MGCPQKEYLTRCGVARRRAYPSIFIRRRLHGYISRNVTITNAGTPSAETSSCFWRSGAARRCVARILEACRPPFALRHCLYPIFQPRPRKTKHTGEYVSRICVSRVLAGFILAGTFRCHRGVIEHRRAVKRFARAPINPQFTGNASDPHLSTFYFFSFFSPFVQ